MDKVYEIWLEEFISELAIYINVSEEEARVYVEELGENGLKDLFEMKLTPREAVIDEVTCWNETFEHEDRIRLH